MHWLHGQRLSFYIFGLSYLCGKKDDFLLWWYGCKVVKRLNGWQGKILTYGGRVVMIKSVLQSMPTYILTVINPLVSTLNLLEQHFASFYWESSDKKAKYHWRSWYWYQKHEWHLQHLSHQKMVELHGSTFFMADFLREKYCNSVRPVSKAWTSRNSQTWKSLIKARENTERNILWHINLGCCSMWWDNWIEKDVLADLYPGNIDNNNNKG